MSRPTPVLARLRPELVDRARRPAPIDNSNALPSGAWAEILGLSPSTVIRVDDPNVRGLPALNRARSMVCNGVVQMLCAATVTRRGEPIDKPLIIGRPHPLLTAWTFYSQVVDSLIVHGNYVAIRHDDQLIPVSLGAVSVDSSSGLPLYTIGNRKFSWAEVWHVMSNAPVGTWWGQGVVETFRRSLSEMVHSQAYGEASFRHPLPPLFVQLDKANPTQDEVDEAKSGLMRKLEGDKQEPLVYGKGILKAESIGWTPQDAQFVEARKLSYAEACWLVGLKPDDIGATIAGSGASVSYGNRTDDALQRIVDGYGPWTTMLEQSLSDLLPNGTVVHGNAESLLKMSPKERLELRKLAQEIGIETPEESRAEEGRGPITTTAEEQTETEAGPQSGGTE